MLEAMAQQPARGPKRRRLEAEHTDLMTGVKDDTVGEDVLVRHLNDYVERVDTDMVPSGLLRIAARVDHSKDAPVQHFSRHADDMMC